ncbi:class I SAM-dependent methyltransferase [Rhizobium calliandrae]|uniref:Class I SAM-dependent methyltransferase n=1 Tax=Rhizobium calliandrae TaxID=1312182 RepID=A0ABT7KJ48_9HYPH|nr:class I SAM-dependent methyltransferase [Rhizobium calliandrae]MDL2408651.1 class I SAM-dependent methyltransferase [Rhizobium calliandrae]
MLTAMTLESWRTSPRLTTFSTFFEQAARGLAGAPDLAPPLPDMSLLDFDLDCLVFWDTHRHLWGFFDSHYFASIPYRLEEELRLGAALYSSAILTWAREGRPATFYSLGAGTGCLARTLAKLGAGRIKTLCCSPTEGNRISFNAKRGSADATFFHGPFFDLTRERYADDETLSPFRNGFDFLFEDTTFQMYGPDRESQLAFILPRIRQGGLLVQVQKLGLKDTKAYGDRERQKDALFKARFFSESEINRKKEDVVDPMLRMQVDLDATASALSCFFRFSVITWNSGNFYTIISGNSRRSITDFVVSTLAPAIPSAFCYAPLPQVVLGDQAFAEAVARAWRPPRSSLASM